MGCFRIWDELDEIEKSKPKPDLARGFIQWKGTKVCMDWSFPCGYDEHLDVDFAYFIRCPSCKRVWKNQSVVWMEEADEDDYGNGTFIIDPEWQG